MRNVSIDRPTTLIRITKQEEFAIKKKLFTKNLDFYNIEEDNIFEKNIDFEQNKKLDNIDFDDSHMFSDMSEAWNNPKSIYESLPYDQQSKFSQGDFVNGLFYKPIDNCFIISTLRFDLRVKNYEIFSDNVFVYFFNEFDAISFYRQYFNVFELSFQQFCNWSPIHSDTFLEIEPTIIFSKKDKQEALPMLPKVSEDILYGRRRFLDTVDYYNNLKTSLNKTELQKITDDLSNGITDFVFLNTKELAVGNKSNKIMQDAIKIMSGEEIDRLFDFLEYDIAPISATKHGAYTIQTLLNYSTNLSHKKLITKYFEKEGEYLLAHDIGNYTFQKLLRFDENLVQKFFISNFEDVATSDLGIKVFKRCVEFLVPCKDELLSKLEDFQDLPSVIVQQLKQIISNL